MYIQLAIKIVFDCKVIINLSSAHLDPDVWTEPHKFNPERFLNDKNDVINKDRMIAFSFGMLTIIFWQLFYILI